MTRRVAVALAAAVAITAGALTYAVGATFGLFGNNRPGHTGQLAPVADVPDDQAPALDVETVYVDVTEPPAPPPVRQPAVTARPAAPVETVVLEDPVPPAATAIVDDHEVEHEQEDD